MLFQTWPDRLQSGDRADQGLRQAPDNVLDRDGQREIGRRQSEIARDRRQKQAKALADPHAEAQQHRSSDQDQPRLVAARNDHSWHSRGDSNVVNTARTWT